MATRRIHSSAILASAMALLVGLAGMWGASGYDFGSARQIGPAVFPFGLSLILTITGLGILVEDFLSSSDEGSLNTAPVRVVLSVLGGPVAFALLIEKFGLIPAIFACVLIASVADRESKPVTAVIVAAVMSLLCSVVFIQILKLPIDTINW